MIDPGGGRITKSSRSAARPSAAAGAGSGWIANGGDGTVSRIDRDSQATTIPVGGEPTAIAFADGSLWVADGQNGRVDQVDSRTNHVVHRLPAGNAPRGVAVAGGAVWVTLGGRRSGRPPRPRAPRPEPADRGPRRARRDRRGLRGRVGGGRGERVVTKLDPRSGRVLKSIGVGNGPAAIASATAASGSPIATTAP